jgi:excisionase family DNA binding protein
VAAQHALEQLDVLAEVSRAEEQFAHARLCRFAHALRTMGVIQQLAHALTKRPQVAGVHEEAGQIDPRTWAMLADLADRCPRVAAALATLRLDDEAALRELADALRPYLLDVEPEPSDALMTPHEAARRASVHVETIRRAIRCGDLPARHVGRSLRVAADDLDAWLSPDRSRRVRTARPRARSSRRTLADALADSDSTASLC